MSFVALSALYSVAFAKMPAGASIEGLWRNPAGTAVIAIGPCKEDYCGKVAWASERGQREAKPGDDRWTESVHVRQVSKLAWFQRASAAQ